MNIYIVWYCCLTAKEEEPKLLAFVFMKDAQAKCDELKAHGFASGIIKLTT